MGGNFFSFDSLLSGIGINVKYNLVYSLESRENRIQFSKSICKFCIHHSIASDFCRKASQINFITTPKKYFPLQEMANNSLCSWFNQELKTISSSSKYSFSLAKFDSFKNITGELKAIASEYSFSRGCSFESCHAM